MVIIEYSDRGQPISDFHLEQWVETVKRYADRHKVLSVSTSAPITAVRLAICRQEIDHHKVVFRHNGRDFKPNIYGDIHNWPAGFADIEARLLEELRTHKLDRFARELLSEASKRKKKASQTTRPQTNK